MSGHPGLADLWAHVAAGGRRDFLVLPDRRLTYADLDHAVRRWLGWFDAVGLAEGDRLVIRSTDEVAQVTGFLAALVDGVVPVLLAADTPPARLAAVIAAVEPRGLVSDAATAPPDVAEDIAALALATDATPARRGWFGRKQTRLPLPGLPESPAHRSPRLPADAAGLAYILFTSGTTAAPTGVMITRGNLLANLATQTRMFGYDRTARIFNDMILAHADGMIQGPVQALAAGCAVIRSGGFSLPGLEGWLGRVRAERATHVITVPTVWAMIDRYAAHDDYFDAPECGLLMSCAALLPEDLWQRLEARFSRPVYNQYGLTETVVTALWAGPHPDMGGTGTIGKPVDGAARVADPGPDGVGELQLKGPHLFPGYWRDPQRTRESFTSDGWLHTGDLAKQLPDGSFAYVGRTKSLVMMGGFLIRPEEIDEAMLRHPQVAESVTLGLPDELFGEVPVTAVVPTTGASIAEPMLAAHAGNHLEAQKVPRRIVVLPAIPRGLSGKPVLEVLRPLLAEGHQSGAAGAARPTLLAAVIAVAADVFRVTPEQLSAASGPGIVAGWDSFSHLNFVLAAEQHFGIAIPAARVATIASIGDMERAVRDLTR